MLSFFSGFALCYEKNALQCQRNHLIKECEGSGITTLGKTNDELARKIADYIDENRDSDYQFEVRLDTLIFDDDDVEVLPEVEEEETD